jgi:hypothetical protein
MLIFATYILIKIIQIIFNIISECKICSMLRVSKVPPDDELVFSKHVVEDVRTGTKQMK